MARMYLRGYETLEHGASTIGFVKPALSRIGSIVFSKRRNEFALKSRYGFAEIGQAGNNEKRKSRS